ncbi:hypothetical protein GCM10011352_04640 [Marinobacterium zhoushanense]|uniref:Phospholipase D-like protein n=1 Tax=Marinobacterium zhoushanense TaxID=1679163 RepID=A0ABQ1K214_9GAMM|nr:phospholipase D-like domain-containing protein DpdK [Marinobacterium zhoushanense]GGB81931.1 hypothetical protein GCM10011352_04640 [Marinobacterium zhoushanense]
MSQITSRQIHTFRDLGKRTAKDLLVSQFVVMTISPPPEIWVVSPWIKDFPVLEDPSEPFRAIGWEKPVLYFSDLVSIVVNNGSRLNLVVKRDDRNDTFLTRLRDLILDPDNTRFGESDELHIKGLLTETIYIKGSMNFTYRGANINDEGITYETEPEIVSLSRQQFREHYKNVLGNWRS